MDRDDECRVHGRLVVVAAGRREETVNVCAAPGVRGVYERVYRRPAGGLTPAAVEQWGRGTSDLAAFYAALEAHDFTNEGRRGNY